MLLSRRSAFTWSPRCYPRWLSLREWRRSRHTPRTSRHRPSSLLLNFLASIPELHLESTVSSRSLCPSRRSHPPRGAATAERSSTARTILLSRVGLAQKTPLPSVTTTRTTLLSIACSRAGRAMIPTTWATRRLSALGHVPSVRPRWRSSRAATPPRSSCGMPRAKSSCSGPSRSPTPTPHKPLSLRPPTLPFFWGWCTETPLTTRIPPRGV
mmetsp:Transcript_66231/g.209339  ORF Transcript_66231/g.209339 Transcript_66231/m.209339 type:complete len:212 (-) Transcript_66231:1101-1736(-)